MEVGNILLLDPLFDFFPNAVFVPALSDSAGPEVPVCRLVHGGANLDFIFVLSAGGGLSAGEGAATAAPAAFHQGAAECDFMEEAEFPLGGEVDFGDESFVRPGPWGGRGFPAESPNVHDKNIGG